MKMRTLITTGLLAALVLASGPRAFAEHPPEEGRLHKGDPVRGKRVALRLERLSANLGLTEEQKAEIRPVLEDEAEEMRALRLDTSLPEEEKQATVEAIREATRSRIREVLTPEQQAKLDELREERQEATFSQKRKPGKTVVDDEE